ncbi:histidine phosphatase superfamily [Sporodiniella umbellata]|nr:histidine phosphatase superfamily [Sporodiniella umbellata]
MDSYNHLPKKLKNKYIVQRHGFSLANFKKIICSNPDIAIPATGGPLGDGYGLHLRGEQQVEQSAELLADYLKENDMKDVLLYCSPFKRTVETAAITRKILNEELKAEIGEATQVYELRERWYGEMDLRLDINYQVCWSDDHGVPDHGEDSAYGIESPRTVADRVTRFIAEEIESKFEGKTIVLISHGDVCQILLTAFRGDEPWKHRSIKHVDTANWRLCKRLYE